MNADPRLRHSGRVTGYPYLLLVDGHDVRSIDVAVFSRFPLADIRTHVDLRDGNERIFSRDCLEVVVDLPLSKPLVLCVTHLKSKFTSDRKGDTPEKLRVRRTEGNAQRLPEARTILGRVRVDEDAPDVAGTPPERRLPFRFPRYVPVLEDLSRNIADHCPVKIWF